MTRSRGVSWSPEQVQRIMAERDAARDALLAVTHACFPAGASAALLGRCDPVWQTVAVVLWGDPIAQVQE